MEGGRGGLREKDNPFSVMVSPSCLLKVEGGRVRAIYSINMVGRKERIKLKIIEGREIM